jgi:hypothetical protein
MLFNNKLLVLGPIAALSLCGAAPAGKKGEPREVETTRPPARALWQARTNVGALDVFDGPGGKGHRPPRAGFKFVEEDVGGSNPKFTVSTPNGIKWKVKLGIEARPEVVVTRLIWAIGYFADEDYFVSELRPAGMPARLRRGREFVAADGTIHFARLEREAKAGRKLGEWNWRHNPFENTREFNALRVFMAVINGWDLKDENNSVRELGAGRQIYYVSDLGSAFGTNNLNRPREISKGDLASYRASRFIDRVTSGYVDFDTPHRPPLTFLVNPIAFIKRVKLDWIGKHIPREDAQWTGELLGRLSPAQIEDAFRAAAYSPAEIQGFTRVIQTRIAELRKL